MHVPSPLRAAIGLVATAADEARQLPERVIEAPMLAVSTAVQLSMRAQQRYARLTARGDEVLRRGPGEEPPPWATFDDPPPPDELASEIDPQRLRQQFPAARGDDEHRATVLDGFFGLREQSAWTAAEPDQLPEAPVDVDDPQIHGKNVSSPRNRAPSRFDQVAPDTDDDEAD